MDEKYFEELGLTAEQMKAVEEKIKVESERIKAETEKVFKSQIESVEKEYKVMELLVKSGARNIKACMALLDLEDSNDIQGQIDELKSSSDTAFLFSQKHELSGIAPFSKTEHSKVNLDSMTYSQMCEYMQNNALGFNENV